MYKVNSVKIWFEMKGLYLGILVYLEKCKHNLTNLLVDCDSQKGLFVQRTSGLRMRPKPKRPVVKQSSISSRSRPSHDGHSPSLQIGHNPSHSHFGHHSHKVSMSPNGHQSHSSFLKSPSPSNHNTTTNSGTLYHGSTVNNYYYISNHSKQSIKDKLSSNEIETKEEKHETVQESGIVDSMKKKASRKLRKVANKKRQFVKETWKNKYSKSANAAGIIAKGSIYATTAAGGAGAHAAAIGVKAGTGDLSGAAVKIKDSLSQNQSIFSQKANMNKAGGTDLGFKVPNIIQEESQSSHSKKKSRDPKQTDSDDDDDDN